MDKNFYCTLEGMENCGKTTQTALLAEHYRNLGQDVIQIKEPGSDQITSCNILRELALDNTKNFSRITRELIMQASRSELFEKLVNPAEKKLILSDRSLVSGIIYAGFEGLDVEKIWDLCMFATSGKRPDLVIFLDNPFKKVRTNYDEKDLYDSKESALDEYFNKNKQYFTEFLINREITVTNYSLTKGDKIVNTEMLVTIIDLEIAWKFSLGTTEKPL